MTFIQTNNNRLPLDIINYNADNQVFEIKSSHDKDNNVIRFSYVLEPVVQDSAPQNYSLYLLYKNSFSENDIFQVYDKEQKERMGWIFPLQSLRSREHDCADNQHFLRYAFAAFQKLLLNEDNTTNLSAEQEEHDLKEIYDDNCIALVLSNEKLPKDFSFESYLPNLFQFGYYRKAQGFQSVVIDHPSKTRFNIQRISSELSSDEFVIQVYQELIYEQHPLVKFHVLYQVIECLIEKILHYELESISTRLKLKKIYTRDFQDKLTSFMSEEKRIKKLFSEYVSGINVEDVNRCCHSLLNCIGKEDCSGIEIGKSLYMVRNFIVHDYRNFPRDEIETLKNLNSSLEILVADLLLSFKQPT